MEYLLQQLVGTGERGDDIALLWVRLLAVAPQPFHLRLPSDVTSLDVVRDAMRSWLAAAPCQRDRTPTTSSWRSGKRARMRSSTRWTPVRTPWRCRAELTDAGLRIAVDDTETWSQPVDRPNRGFGLRLMEAAMTVEIVPASTGTRVTLEKSLAGAGEPPG